MVTVRLFAAAREAAGTPAVNVPGGTVAEVCAELVQALGPGFGRVLAVSSVLVSGDRVRSDSALRIPDGAIVDVLPPFAGG